MGNCVDKVIPILATEVFNDEILDALEVMRLDRLETESDVFVFIDSCVDNKTFIELIFELIVDILDPFRFIKPSCEAKVRFVDVINDETLLLFRFIIFSCDVNVLPTLFKPLLKPLIILA